MTDHDIVAFQLGTAASLGCIKTAVDKIEGHLQTLNGTVLRHSREIEAARETMQTHAAHCPMLHEVAEIKQDMAILDARKRLNKVWLSGLWAAAGLAIGVFGKVLVGMVIK